MTTIVWCVEWRTPQMPATAFDYFRDEDTAHRCAYRIQQMGADALVRPAKVRAERAAEITR